MLVYIPTNFPVLHICKLYNDLGETETRATLEYWLSYQWTPTAVDIFPMRLLSAMHK